MAELFMKPTSAKEFDHLLLPQEELLKGARGIVGPLVGASLFIDEEKGWSIRLTLLKSITNEERAALELLTSSFKEPIFIEEKKRAPKLTTITLNTTAQKSRSL